MSARQGIQRGEKYAHQKIAITIWSVKFKLWLRNDIDDSVELTHPYERHIAADCTVDAAEFVRLITGSSGVVIGIETSDNETIEGVEIQSVDRVCEAIV